MMREKIQALINEGQRNLAIDLSGLTYLYSDAMNVLFNLNRQILDVNGRLALVAPSADVSQILQGAGIYNFIKVYPTDDDLLRSSEEIIMQTSGYSLSALKKQAGMEDKKAPESEFEDLRAGIEQSMNIEDRTVQPPQQQRTPPQPQRPSPQQGTPQGQPPSQRQQQPRPQAAPPPPPAAQQPPQPQETPSFEPPAPPAHEEPVSFPEPQPQSKKVDRWEEDEPSKKKSPVGALLVVFVLLAGIAGAGVYFWPQISDIIAQRTQVTEEPASTRPPQLPTEEEPSGSDVAEAGENTEEAQEEKQEVAKPSKPARSVSRTPSRPARRATTRRSRPKPPPPAPKPTNELVVRTSPSGATISIDGNVVGKSPYTWTNPKVRGAVRVKAEMPGYTTKTEMVEYLGGKKQETLALVEAPKAPPAPPRPVASSTPPPAPKPTPEPPAPKPEPTPPPAPKTASAPPPPAPPAPAASSQAAGEPGTVFVSSIPPVADVYMDGKHIGKTNIAKLNVSSGTHTMKFVKGSKEHTVEMTFKPGDNPAKHVTF